MAKNLPLEVRRTAAMSMSFSPATMSMLHTLFGYPLLAGLIEEPTPETSTAYKHDYARRAGYKLGANGEWIAELPCEHPAKR
jgi:hypothetical protein